MRWRGLLFDDDTAMVWTTWGISAEADPEPEPGEPGVTVVLAVRDDVTMTVAVRDSVTVTLTTGD